MNNTLSSFECINASNIHNSIPDRSVGRKPLNEAENILSLRSKILFSSVGISDVIDGPGDTKLIHQSMLRLQIKD